MGVIRVTGAGSHAVETWNIDGLKIDQVIARDVGESGLLLQNTRNAQVNLVDGNNVGAGTGYATLRFANQNGRNANGNYNTNVYVTKVISRGGGRGVFCVSESGGAVIESVVSITLLLLWITVFHVLECSRMQHFRLRSR